MNKWWEDSPVVDEWWKDSPEVAVLDPAEEERQIKDVVMMSEKTGVSPSRLMRRQTMKRPFQSRGISGNRRAETGRKERGRHCRLLE